MGKGPHRPLPNGFAVYTEVIQVLQCYHPPYFTIRGLHSILGKQKRENKWEGRQIPRKSNSTRSSYHPFIFPLSIYVYTCTMIRYRHSVASSYTLPNTFKKPRVRVFDEQTRAKVNSRVGKHVGGNKWEARTSAFCAVKSETVYGFLILDTTARKHVDGMEWEDQWVAGWKRTRAFFNFETLGPPSTTESPFLFHKP